MYVHVCVLSYLEITPISQDELGRLTLPLFSLYKQNWLHPYILHYIITWIQLVFLEMVINKNYCRWECKLTQSLWRTVRRFPKKLNIELPYDPAATILDIYPEKTIILKDMCTPMFITALFTTARTWKLSKCPTTDEQINKMWCIHTMEIYCVPVCSGMSDPLQPHGL